LTGLGGSLPLSQEGNFSVDLPDLPRINLDHLRTMTDGTGLFQHASYVVPKRRHGYTTDDNARAALAAYRHWKLLRDERIIPLLRTYLSFLHYAYDPESSAVRNYLSYDRQWMEEKGSEDSHGRLLWSIGTLVPADPESLLSGFATPLFHQTLGGANDFRSPRAKAFAVLGSVRYLSRFGGDRNASLTCQRLAEELLDRFKENSSAEWPWLEDIVSYENARLPQALIAAGRFFDWGEMIDWGLKALRWLLEVQKNGEKGHLSLIGSDGWLRRGGERAHYDQQPVEAAALIDACYEGFRATENFFYVAEMKRSFKWFLGDNDLGESLYDFRTGGCQDGLHPTRVNRNQGGESLVSWLLALLRMYRLAGDIGQGGEEVD